MVNRLTWQNDQQMERKRGQGPAMARPHQALVHPHPVGCFVGLLLSILPLGCDGLLPESPPPAPETAVQVSSSKVMGAQAGSSQRAQAADPDAHPTPPVGDGKPKGPRIAPPGWDDSLGTPPENWEALGLGAEGNPAAIPVGGDRPVHKAAPPGWRDDGSGTPVPAPSGGNGPEHKIVPPGWQEGASGTPLPGIPEEQERAAAALEAHAPAGDGLPLGKPEPAPPGAGSTSAAGRVWQWATGQDSSGSEGNNSMRPSPLVGELGRAISPGGVGAVLPPGALTEPLPGEVLPVGAATGHMPGSTIEILAAIPLPGLQGVTLQQLVVGLLHLQTQDSDALSREKRQALASLLTQWRTTLVLASNVELEITSLLTDRQKEQVFQRQIVTGVPPMTVLELADALGTLAARLPSGNTTTASTTTFQGRPWKFVFPLSSLVPGLEVLVSNHSLEPAIGAKIGALLRQSEHAIRTAAQGIARVPELLTNQDMAAIQEALSTGTLPEPDTTKPWIPTGLVILDQAIEKVAP